MKHAFQMKPQKIPLKGKKSNNIKDGYFTHCTTHETGRNDVKQITFRYIPIQLQGGYTHHIISNFNKDIFKDFFHVFSLFATSRTVWNENYAYVQTNTPLLMRYKVPQVPRWIKWLKRAGIEVLY